jgi:beta-1,4-mannosyltransferase
MMRAVVLVGGDLGRSPRMVRHAECLSAQGWAVTLVGYAGRPLAESVRHAMHVIALPVPAAPAGGGLAWAWGSAQRFGRLLWRLDRALAALGPQSLYLVQTPPALPIVPVARRAARRAGAALALDWHNLQAPLLALRLGTRHPLVAAVAAFEARQTAEVHLAVTHALATQRPNACVFQDRPLTYLPATPGPTPTAVMASSFSADDDLHLLTEGLRRHGRPLRLLLTGDGPRRAEALERLATVPQLEVDAQWLPAEAYLPTLATAHVGLSVHRSASGWDFPIKLTDYAAAGLPSLALDYGAALREGVLPSDRTFTDAQGFAEGLQALLAQGTRPARGLTWAEGWRLEAWPALNAAARAR